MKSYSRGLFLWVFLALVVMLAFTMVGNDVRDKEQEVDFSDLMAEVESSNVSEITIKGQEVHAVLNSGERVRTIGPRDSDAFFEQLADKEIYPNFEPEPDGGLLALATTALPVILIFVFFLLVFVFCLS